MSKTIPIWACVINRALIGLRKVLDKRPVEDGSERHSSDWDCELHLPIWVSETEKNNIANRLETWVEDLKTSGADLAPLARTLRKPLRTLWVSQRTVIWLNEVVDTESLDFTPVFLVSASQPGSCTRLMTDAEFSWTYIPGAADDEESWARGLTPALFWKHVYDLVNDGPVDCNRQVAELVERNRVYRALRGQDAPQLKVKSSGNFQADPGMELIDDSSCSDAAGCHEKALSEKREAETLQDGFNHNTGVKCGYPLNGRRTDLVPGLHWIGSTGLAVGGSSCCQADSLCEVVDCVLDVCPSGCSTSSIREDYYLHLPVVGSKFDRHCLHNSLPEAVKFAREKLENGLSLLICCPDGEDISVSVCLAILLSCFDYRGNFCSAGFDPKSISKSKVRQKLVQLAHFHSGARPSRGSLKQVYNYLQNLQ